MGRKPSKSKSFSLFGLLKMFVFAGLVFGVIYGISYGVSEFSRLDLATLLDKSLVPIPEVAGKYIERGSSLLNRDKEDEVPVNSREILKIALLSDSHNDNDNLASAITKSTDIGAQAIVFLGDYTSVGSLDELKKAKEAMDTSTLPYYSVPGDHDLWKSEGSLNFTSVFGQRYGSLAINGVKLILIDNSDNEIGVDKDQLKWFSEELESVDGNVQTFVFMSNPLYNSDGFKLMGENNEAVSDQAALLLSLIRSSSVKAVLAGDNHRSDKVLDPERDTLTHIVVGALTKERNLQTPRFDILTVYENGEHRVSEIIL
ncbi:hypothetical protein A2716_02950 [candidate division WWE3 bacterium RIFCSPHIGHO2_01_FULL_40_23]|uniref:Calcineurin-like phosphoesterase domain-containing protein n=1 Tax=candidate division WWE3 bacterium RIFCSPLOWO2_01_FULL_41_18 TaxID=1802625 RepID=A0A1F4VCB7_UNCKA|nr:MAG: hypothetical protein A2716_02950 [candidate division WWE3 bacterium RIFCSPHIGHO2_01_FULL_40_23]OGC54769.1 MAG: hypothetical protein A3A78_05145 [candidate division WWE3 bacterium RIFCSPLOWO2_01_FULL_41_18]